MGYLGLLKAHPRPLAFGFATAFFSGLGQTHFLSLFNPQVMETFSLTHAQYGSLYSLVTLASGFFMTALGPFLDRWDLRICAALTALGLFLGQAFVFWQGSLLILAIGLFCLRLFGQGLCSSLSSIAISRFFDGQRGKALALSQLGFPIYEGLMTPLFAAILIWGGFAMANWVLLALLLFIYLPLSWLLTRDRPDFNFAPAEALESPKPKETGQANTTNSVTAHVPADWTRERVIRHPTLYCLLPQALMPPFALTGLLFHQVAISEAKSWSVALMASGLLFFAIGRTLNSFVTGPLVDRFQAWRLFPFYQIPLALGFFTMGLLPQTWVPGLSFLLFGLTVGSGGPIKSAIWAELYGIRHLGAIKSFFATVMVFSTAASPALFGWILERPGGPQALLVGLGITTLVASVIAGLGLRQFFKNQPWRIPNRA